MTDSKNDKAMRRQNKLSPQNENFDFELVEVPIAADEITPLPSPLTDFSEPDFANSHRNEDTNTVDNDYDAIDKVLNTTHFDEANAAEIPATETLRSERKPLIPPPAVVSEIKTNFYVDYFDKRKKINIPQEEPASAIPKPVVDAIKPENTQLPPEDINNPLFNGSGMAVAVLSQFKSKQESINKQQEKLIQEFSKKIKAATTVTYTAVFFGVISLVAATTLGVMLVKTKSEVSDLAGTTTALKDNIKNMAKTPPYEMEGTDPAIDQLSQKVETVIEQSQASTSGLKNEVAALQNKITQLEKTAASKPIITASKAIINTPPPVTRAPHSHAPVMPAEDILEAVDEPIVPAPVAPTPAPIIKAVETKKPVTEPVAKIAPSSKPLKKVLSEQTAANKLAPLAASKPQSKPVTPPKKSAIPDNTANVPDNDINNIPKSANTTASITAKSGAGWTVNLASSNKLDDAKKTAARFTKQGIPVTVSPYTIKNTTHYRLQVKGFKTKEEATAYGNKAKSALKLNAIWINP